MMHGPANFKYLPCLQQLDNYINSVCLFHFMVGAYLLSPFKIYVYFVT